MKKFLLFATAIFIVLFAACHKKDDCIIPPPDDIVNDTSKDIRTVRLKTVVEQNLPSPYFNFMYSDSGYATAVSFASNFFVYKLEYKNGRLSKMINTKNGDTLHYYYTGGKVTAVRKYNVIGSRIKSYTFGYGGTGKLAVMQVYKFADGSETDSIQERNVRLQYDENGNLFRKLEMHLTQGNELEWSGTDEYSEYDQGNNVDDFYLLKIETFEDFVFLPQVRLQKNNPRKVVHTAVNNDFKVDYIYSYINGLPVAKTGRMEWTRGTDVGKGFTFTNRYTYW